MILANVNIGTGPSAGDGDPLRTAFNTINQNFDAIESNVNSLTNSVRSVAGRTGNVLLTTQDIIGINNYATTSYVTSITGGNVLANVQALESNVTLIQADINTLYGNAGVQSSTLATLTSNAATQAGTLATLTANAAAQSGDLATLLANAAVQAGNIASLLANAGSQHEAISSLQSNAAVQAGLIADLQANASVQAGLIASATGTYSNSNVASYLTGYAGNVAVDYITFTDTSVQRTAYNGQQWRTNLTSSLLTKPSWLSYYPDGEKTVLNTNYGFDSNGMWFYGNADNQHAYPIRTNVHFHDTDVVEIIFTINFANANNDHGIAIFNSTTTQPIWKTTTNLSRIALQLSVGTPAIYGLATSDVGTSNLLTGGNDYTFKFTYDPTAGSNNVTVNIYDGTSTNDPLLETLAISETLPAGDFVIGFDADQDAAGFKSYYTSLIVRSLTNIIVNDLEVQGQITGNLIPSANVTYSLGNVTHQWRELWVSGNTIHIGGATLSVANGAVQSSLPIEANVTATNITVQGTRIDFGQGSYIEETEVVGQPGTYGLALNSPDDGIVGLNALDSNASVTSSVIVSNVLVQVNVANSTPGGNALVWAYDQTGVLSLPEGGDIVDFNGNSVLGGTATGITSADDITITNAVGGSNVADIYIESADDITVQAKNRTIPGPREGGDLNLYAGDGGVDDIDEGSGGGGDIQLYAGDGGAGNLNSGSFGGTVGIRAGNGGDGSATASAGAGGGISITAGHGGANTGGGGSNGGGIYITAGDATDSAHDRGSIVLTSGEGGDETSIGGYVQISIPQVGTNPGGDWVFTGVGTVFEPPPNAEIVSPSVGNLTLGTVGNTIVRNIGGVTTYDWVFGDNGKLTLPLNGDINFNAGGIWQTPDEDFVIRVQDADNDDFELRLEVDDGANNIYSRIRQRRDDVQIGLGLTTGPAKYYRFRDTGELEIPGDIHGEYGGSANLMIRGATSSSFVTLKTVDNTDTLRSNVTVGTANVTISTANAAYNWTFSETGILTVPDEGVIRSNNDTIILQSYDTGNNIGRGARIGTNGNMYFEIGANTAWLNLVNSNGNAFIYSAVGVSGGGGRDIDIFAGSSDPITWNSNPGGNVNIVGGYGSFGDGGGGPGGDVNIVGGLSSDSHTGNVNIKSGTNTWIFNYNGNLTLPAGGQILDSTGNIYASGSSYGNTEVESFITTFAGNVPQASVAYSVNISPVLLNQEYHMAILPAKEGQYGVKAADGTANVTYNPASNRLTSANIQATGSIQTSGVNGRIGYSSGGYVIQSGNSSGVSLNTISGNIKLDTVNIASSSTHTVALTNNKLEATDLILVQGIDTTAIDLHIGAYYFSTNTAIIYLRNISGSAIGPITPMLKFAIIKAPSS